MRGVPQHIRTVITSCRRERGDVLACSRSVVDDLHTHQGDVVVEILGEDLWGDALTLRDVGGLIGDSHQSHAQIRSDSLEDVAIGGKVRFIDDDG